MAYHIFGFSFGWKSPQKRVLELGLKEGFKKTRWVKEELFIEGG